MTTIPAGWKLVPEVMPLEMSIAFAEVWYSKRRAIDDEDMQDAYGAMIEAAPAAPFSAAPASAQEEAKEDDQIAVLSVAGIICGHLDTVLGQSKVMAAARDIAGLFVAPAPAAGDAQTNAARDVLAERQRQISAEGWTPDHDDEHSNGEIAYAATSYAVEAAHLVDGMKPSPTRSPPFSWPPQWDTSWWKPSDTPRRNLVKAGALILAEIERLDRAASQQQEG